MKLVDAVGHEHRSIRSGENTPRIVSLVPSITELLCDLGLQDWLVGRTGFCIHPEPVVRTIAKVGGTKDVNINKIRTLAPTHLVVNIDENEKPTVDRLAEFIPNIVVTHPLAPRDNLGLYRLLGGIFCAEARAEILCADFEQAYQMLQQHRRNPSQSVLYCIWKDPWMTVSPDTYIAAMLAEIGWHQVMVTEKGRAPRRYPAFNWTEELTGSIDRVLLSTEPYSFTDQHVDALEKQIGKPVQLVDGEMLSWYGTRAIHGLRYLRQLAE